MRAWNSWGHPLLFKPAIADGVVCGVLEQEYVDVYFVIEHQPTTCDQYPASGLITFTDINVLWEGKSAEPAWQAFTYVLHGPFGAWCVLRALRGAHLAAPPPFHHPATFGAPFVSLLGEVGSYQDACSCVGVVDSSSQLHFTWNPSQVQVVAAQ